MVRRTTKQAETQEEGVPNAPESIGHITTPIDDIRRIKPVFERHSVIMVKCRTNDNWWTLLFPDGTTKILQNKGGGESFYLVSLPDGFTFEYIHPIFAKTAKEKYERFPSITLL